LILDVTFGEDACRVRPSMHPTIWHCYVALPSMRPIEPVYKQSLRQKSKAAMDDCFMPVLAAVLLDPNDEKILCQSIASLRCA